MVVPTAPGLGVSSSMCWTVPSPGAVWAVRPQELPRRDLTRATSRPRSTTHGRGPTRRSRNEAFERVKQRKEADAPPCPTALALGDLREDPRALESSDPEACSLVAHIEGVLDRWE